MAPVVEALKASGIPTYVISTGQHKDLLTGALKAFDMTVDYQLELENKRASTFLGSCVSHLADLFNAVWLTGHRPSLVVAQGDTTTVAAAALACQYEQMAFAHVEAGLRTFNMASPWPEEFNRCVADLGAQLCFAPTPSAEKNLITLRGSRTDAVHLVGNTVIDALTKIMPTCGHYEHERPYAVMTCHRRENFGEPMRQIFTAVKAFALRHKDMDIVFPVHPNPRVHEHMGILCGQSNIELLPALPYEQFLPVLRGAKMIITDSGGLQEEGAFLNKPMVVCRGTTERLEAIDGRRTQLANPNTQDVIAALESVYANSQDQNFVPNTVFGDGHAGRRIAELIKWHLST